jgi:uncharacterized protein
MILLLLVIGILGGMLSGLLGIGAGSIYVPSMVLILHITQQAAQGLSLLVMIPSSLLGVTVYWRKNLVAKQYLPLLIAGGICGSVLGASLANLLPTQLLSKFFAITILGGGIAMFRD